MPIVTINNISKYFGNVDLFKELSFGVDKGHRVGIVGPNGIGKSSLLKIIAKVDEEFSGEIHYAKNITIGYLPQEADVKYAGTLYDFCEVVFADLIMMEQSMLEKQLGLESDPDNQQLLQEVGEMQHRFENIGGYQYTTRIKQILAGIGFSTNDLDKELSTFSGGQKTRAYLARLLLVDPDILLLDEPTNHLDIEAVRWLEGYIASWGGSALIISHDRYFLNKSVNSILEMTDLGVEFYRGNYDHYLSQRQQRWERRKEIFDREVARLKKEFDYIKKNISGQNFVQAKGKLKRLSRQVQAIEQVGIEAVLSTKWSQMKVETTTSVFGVEEAERRLNALKLPDPRPPVLHLNIRSVHRSGEIILRAKDLAIGWNGVPLLQIPELELTRKECAALIGPNGSGKSTFLKTLLEKIPPVSGEFNLGASLKIGYFAQAHEDLNIENNLIQELQTIKTNLLDHEARSLLGSFLFSGDDAYKKVSVLSGGERGRLALAKLSLQKTNFLILDEPTNHLDIPSQEILEQVLEKFEGTIILVSHDRYLIDAIATQIWEIDPSEKGLDVFSGSYHQYMEYKESQKALAVAQVAFKEDNGSSSNANNPKQRKNRTNAERNKERRIIELEEKIAKLELAKEQLTDDLNKTNLSLDRVIALTSDFNKISDQISELFIEWSALSAEVEDENSLH